MFVYVPKSVIEYVKILFFAKLWAKRGLRLEHLATYCIFWWVKIRFLNLKRYWIEFREERKSESYYWYSKVDGMRIYFIFIIQRFRGSFTDVLWRNFYEVILLYSFSSVDVFLHPDPNAFCVNRCTCTYELQ